MRQQTIDEYYMRHALELALRGMGKTTPNPMVGCVIVRDGEIIARGWHDRLGGLHAEASALAALAESGGSARGSTAYVSLEPCSHWGRQPPCADALVRAGISRCVAAMGDPNPKVSGRGFKILEDAGIETKCGVLAREAAWQNRGFLSLQTRGRPWVTLKAAISQDGSMALSDGTSQWITGPDARSAGHLLRSENDAIITGTGTLVHDNPSLTVRDVEGPSPRPVIVSSSLEYLKGNYAAVTERTISIACSGTVPEGSPVQAVILPHDGTGHPSPSDVLKFLGDMGIARVMLEAGGKLLSSFIKARMVDEYQIFTAPKFMGEGLKVTCGLKLTGMEQTVPMEYLNSRRLAGDMWIEGADPCSLDWLKQLAK